MCQNIEPTLEKRGSTHLRDVHPVKSPGIVMKKYKIIQLTQNIISKGIKQDTIFSLK